MASTSASNIGRQSENEVTNASMEIAASPSTSPIAKVVSLISCCFGWCSLFRSMRSIQSNSIASTSSSSNQPQNIASTSSTNSQPQKELELGDSLPRELEAVMRHASLHLAILSKSYAQSPWCLAELAFMLKTGTRIVPVFYHVKPEDVRYAKGDFADAFARHEQKRRYSIEKLQEWKNALYNVSFNIDHVVNTQDQEEVLLKNIINSILQVIKVVPFVAAKHPIGLDEAVKDFEMTTLQPARLHHTVQIVGIWGMGGSGKTTLAKQFYNNIYRTMERCCFLFDIRDAATRCVLHKKQKELLEDLGLKGVEINNIEEGKTMLASRLRSVRVLIILDDVDDVDQLNALLPTTHYLGWDSIIVVATREFEVLRSWGIKFIYKMKQLDPPHARQLFSWHAFMQPSPYKGFESLVENFISVCDGLPLSLKVLGAHLLGNSNKDYWDAQLVKISRILPHDIKNKLKVSYDVLDDQVKEIFLDVACFFIGEEKTLAIDVWEGSNWIGLQNWERLLNKCLVELDEKNCIKMHDHLRDLGREIANQHSPYRLWSPQQVIKVYQEEHRIRVRGIASKTAASTNEIEDFPKCSPGGEVIINTRGGCCSLPPSSMGLKIFQVKGDYHQIIGDVSGELVMLRWFNIGSSNLRSLGSLKNLRVLELHEEGKDNHSLEELWELDSVAPLQLRRLVVSECTGFKKLPSSIGCLSHLKKLVVSGQIQMRNLPSDFCLLKSLEHLKLDCPELSSLPSDFGNLTNLRHLQLSSCKEMKILPVSFKELILLQHFHLSNCGKLTLEPDIFENMSKLEYVNFYRCKQLEELPAHITNQVSLGELHLYGCERLREVPVNICQMSKLRMLEIGSKLLKSLPTSLGDLSSLTTLQIEFCPELQCLPDSLGFLDRLEILRIIFSGVELLPNSVKQLSNLHTLHILQCPIREFELGAGSLTSSLCNLNRIWLSDIEVPMISISQECCPALEILEIEDDNNLTEIGILPRTLQFLAIKRCPKLEALPCFSQLTSLNNFDLRDCYGVKKIRGLEHCRALEMLRADTKWDVAGIDSLVHLKRLWRVRLRANRKPGVEACIQSMKKSIGEIIVCTQAVPDAASLVDSFAFPTRCNIRSFATQTLCDIRTLTTQNIASEPKLVKEKLPSGDAVILCAVVNCIAPCMKLKVHSMYKTNTVELEEGRWVWIGIFTQRSGWYTAEDYSISRLDSGEGEVEKGLLVTGSEKTIVEVFKRLWTLLGN
ncbi:hypothetical protein SUGI_0695640 [Cryptomeria japonica]|nr:hypothetical protein SUGI_0695640 [Cryptomeria japonica]